MRLRSLHRKDSDIQPKRLDNSGMSMIFILRKNLFENKCQVICVKNLIFISLPVKIDLYDCSRSNTREN